MSRTDTRTSGLRHVAHVAALLASVSLSACASGQESAPVTPVAPLMVRTERVTTTPHTRTIEVGGVVQARTTASVAARVVAPVDTVHVKPGDRVRTGQLLVTLDGDDLGAQARAADAAHAATVGGLAAAQAEERAARAALELATATHTRIDGLRARQSATPQELDDAVAQRRAAEARLDAAVSRVAEANAGVARASASRDAAAVTASFLRIVAPFDGVVTETFVERGNMATPGLPLVRVEDVGRLRVDVRVDASLARALAVGAPVEVALDDGSEPSTVTATVAEIGRAVDADAHTLLVKALLPQGVTSRSGTFARLRLAGREQRALRVPTEALVTHGQVTSVFVVEDGIAHLRLVRVRGTDVVAGLVDGDTIIVSPPATLVDGHPVTTGGPR